MLGHYDVAVVGGGPAGLSASLVLGRARRSVALIDDGNPRNSSVEAMHGYLTRDGSSPREFLKIASREISGYSTVERFAVRATSAEATGGQFLLRLGDGRELISRRVLLSTGMVDVLPEIGGLADRWGVSVFVCPFCDGWEFRDRRIAVYSAGRRAIDLAKEMRGWTDRVVACVECDDLNDDDRAWLAASGTRLVVAKAVRLLGAGRSLSTIEFAGGSGIDCDVLFVDATLRQHSDLVKRLGCRLAPGGSIAVGPGGQTSVSGCYGAGDATTDVHQVIVAAASGARAGIAITLDLLETDAKDLVDARHHTRPISDSKHMTVTGTRGS
jgi:thioredoxin reductase